MQGTICDGCAVGTCGALVDLARLLVRVDRREPRLPPEGPDDFVQLPGDWSMYVTRGLPVDPPDESDRVAPPGVRQLLTDAGADFVRAIDRMMLRGPGPYDAPWVIERAELVDFDVRYAIPQADGWDANGSPVE